MRHVDIAIYLPSLEGGGAEKIMVTLANAFADRGLNVDLVLAKATGPYLSHVSSEVKVVGLGSGGVLRSLPSLVRYLLKRQPRRFLSALSHANVVAIVSHCLARLKKPMFVSERLSLSAANQFEKGFRNRVVRRAMALLYRYPDKVIVVAKAMELELITELRINPKKIVTIYNPIDAHTIARAKSEPPPHPWFNTNQYVFLGCGRLSHQKDFQTLISAFRFVRERQRAKLIILGEGELRPDLEAQIAEQDLSDDVHLAGFVKNPIAYMNHCSAFVLSSLYEGLPGVLIQAMHCDVALISTDCPTGPREILENGRWGQLVPVADVKALAEAMERAMTSPLIDTRERRHAFTEEVATNAYLEVMELTEGPN